jgi:peptide chain release factor 1
MLFNKLDELVQKHESINHQLQNPSIAAQQDKFRQLMKEHAELEKIVKVYQEYKTLTRNLEENKILLTTESDEDLRQMAKDDISAIEPRIEPLAEQLKLLLLPKDPNDEKNILLEIRAEELFRSYGYFAQQHGWSVEVLSISQGNVGGYKEVIAMITGEKVYSTMKYESGVHRVQRVPKTESQGRVHTSTITVAVIPEAEDVEVKVNANDVRIETMRASGAGGQHVNKTDSAVRLTHIPSGIVVYCQEGRSQHANRDTAFKILYSRLKAQEDERVIKEASDARLAQIGTGDRSERIRTYNFPQSRVTDHRIGLTTHNINGIMNGELDPIIQPLMTHYQTEALKAQENASR